MTMRKKPLALIFGLTTSIAFTYSVPTQAANFDYSKVKNISTRPIESNNILNFFGDPAKNEGFVSFFNLDFTAPDVGHTDISLNSPGLIAPYYTTGKDKSPAPSGANRSASLQDLTGFANLFSYLNNNNISPESIGLSYGQKSDRDFTKTWNLGDDILGQDWFASPDSTLEERIYTANPDDVEIFLSYGDTKIVSFGYSDFYTIFEYGATTSIADDVDAILTDPFSAKKVAGLDSVADGLANAFLQDVNGGKLQVVYEQAAVPDGFFEVSDRGYGVVTLPFEFTLRAVSTPEPVSIFGLLTVGTSLLMSRSRKK